MNINVNQGFGLYKNLNQQSLGSTDLASRNPIENQRSAGAATAGADEGLSVRISAAATALRQSGSQNQAADGIESKNTGGDQALAAFKQKASAAAAGGINAEQDRSQVQQGTGDTGGQQAETGRQAEGATQGKVNLGQFNTLLRLQADLTGATPPKGSLLQSRG